MHVKLVIKRLKQISRETEKRIDKAKALEEILMFVEKQKVKTLFSTNECPK